MSFSRTQISDAHNIFGLNVKDFHNLSPNQRQEKLDSVLAVTGQEKEAKSRLQKFYREGTVLQTNEDNYYYLHYQSLSANDFFIINTRQKKLTQKENDFFSHCIQTLSSEYSFFVNNIIATSSPLTLPQHLLHQINDTMITDFAHEGHCEFSYHNMNSFGIKGRNIALRKLLVYPKLPIFLCHLPILIMHTVLFHLLKKLNANSPSIAFKSIHTVVNILLLPIYAFSKQLNTLFFYLNNPVNHLIDNADAVYDFHHCALVLSLVFFLTQSMVTTTSTPLILSMFVMSMLYQIYYATETYRHEVDVFQKSNAHYFAEYPLHPELAAFLSQGFEHANTSMQSEQALAHSQFVKSSYSFKFFRLKSTCASYRDADDEKYPNYRLNKT